MDNDRHMTVVGLYENIKSICDFVSAGARKSGLTDSDIFHIELACDEACTNIIEHAYGGENRGTIQAQWEATPTQFIIKLQDNGRPFNPDSVPAPPEPSTEPKELKIGGLGLHFINKLMDEIDFEFEAIGNTLIMRKNK